MKTLVMTCLSAIMLIGITNGQDLSFGDDVKKHGFGINAGFTTGAGFSYMYWPKQTGVKFVLGTLGGHYASATSAGISFMHSIKESDKSRFFVYQGSHYYTERSKPENYIYSNDLNIGAGFGLEFFQLDDITLQVMAGYGYFTAFNGISLTGEIGIFYRL